MNANDLIGSMGRRSEEGAGLIFLDFVPVIIVNTDNKNDGNDIACDVIILMNHDNSDTNDDSCNNENGNDDNIAKDNVNKSKCNNIGISKENYDNWVDGTEKTVDKHTNEETGK